MIRRSFLYSLIAAPLIGLLAKIKAAPDSRCPYGVSGNSVVTDWSDSDYDYDYAGPTQEDCRRFGMYPSQAQKIVDFEMDRRGNVEYVYNFRVPVGARHYLHIPRARIVEALDGSLDVTGININFVETP